MLAPSRDWRDELLIFIVLASEIEWDVRDVLLIFIVLASRIECIMDFLLNKSLPFVFSWWQIIWSWSSKLKVEKYVTSRGSGSFLSDSGVSIMSAIIRYRRSFLMFFSVSGVSIMGALTNNLIVEAGRADERFVSRTLEENTGWWSDALWLFVGVCILVDWIDERNYEGWYYEQTFRNVVFESKIVEGEECKMLSMKLWLIFMRQSFSCIERRISGFAAMIVYMVWWWSTKCEKCFSFYSFLTSFCDAFWLSVVYFSFFLVIVLTNIR